MNPRETRQGVLGYKSRSAGTSRIFTREAIIVAANSSFFGMISSSLEGLPNASHRAVSLRRGGNVPKADAPDFPLLSDAQPGSGWRLPRPRHRLLQPASLCLPRRRHHRRAAQGIRFTTPGLATCAGDDRPDSWALRYLPDVPSFACIAGDRVPLEPLGLRKSSSRCGDGDGSLGIGSATNAPFSSSAVWLGKLRGDPNSQVPTERVHQASPVEMHESEALLVVRRRS